MRINRSQLLFGAAAVVIVFLLINFLSTGTISVDSAKGSSISVQAISNGYPVIKTGIGSLSAKVGHGQYVITVKYGSNESTQIINFQRGHKSFHYVVGLSDLKTLVPVAAADASSLSVGTQLSYLDAATNRLTQIDPHNHEAQLGSKAFDAVRWANPTFGVGQDDAGLLYAIDNGSSTLLRVPFSYDSGMLAFDVSRDKDVYVSHDATVFTGKADGVLKKIYTAQSSSLVVAGTTGAVAIVPSVDQAGNNPWLVTVTTSGKVVKKQLSGPSKRLAWSPDGRYLASVSDLSVTIYDSFLQTVSVIPTGAIAPPDEGFVGYVAWGGDDQLIYAASDQLWSFEISTGRGALLTNIPQPNAINALAASGDGAYAYITTGAEVQPNDTISRVGLRGQLAPSYLKQFGTLFPTRNSNYSMDYIGFANPPTVVLKPSPDGDLSPQAMLGAAQNQIRQAGIEPNLFQYDVRNSNN